MDITRTYGQNLHDAMTALRMSQSALSRKIGVSQSYLSHIIAGQRSPSMATMSRIARGLGLDARDLLFDAAADAPSAQHLRSRLRAMSAPLSMTRRTATGIATRSPIDVLLAAEDQAASLAQTIAEAIRVLLGHAEQHEPKRRSA